jgi:hypothetical protein
LHARIEAASVALIGYYGGRIENAIAALEQDNDPDAAACATALNERQAIMGVT